MLVMMTGIGHQGGQWLDDMKDWARMGLSVMMHLAGDMKGFREFIHRTVKAPHGVSHLPIAGYSRQVSADSVYLVLCCCTSDAERRRLRCSDATC